MRSLYRSARRRPAIIVSMPAHQLPRPPEDDVTISYSIAVAAPAQCFRMRQAARWHIRKTQSDEAARLLRHAAATTSFYETATII